MTSQHRRWIFSLFACTFIVAAPLILLAVAGFSLDWRTRTVVRSGMILVEVLPEDAAVSVDGVRDDRSSRSRGVIRLFPVRQGTHRITLEKEGYLPHAMTLTVANGGVTAPPPISLIRTTQAFAILPYTSAILATSPNRQWSVLLVQSTGKQKNLVLLDQTRGALRSLPEVPPALNSSRAPIEAHWSPDSSQILVIASQPKTRVGSVYALASQTFTRVFPLPTIVRWADDSSSLYTVDGATVAQLSLKTGEQTTRHTLDGVVDLLPSPTGLLALQRINKQLELVRLEKTYTIGIGLVDAIGLLPSQTRFFPSQFPFPLLRTPTLTLILKITPRKFEVLTEVPSSDGMNATQDDIVSIDHTILYRVAVADPTMVRSTPLKVLKKNTAILSLPTIPWVALVADGDLLLHSTPTDWQPEDQTIALEEHMTISGISVDPLRKRMYIAGSRGQEQGIFVRLLTE